MNRHGTHAGWAAHQRSGERPCDPCWQAKSEYDKRRREAPEYVRRGRLAAKAQGRALRRLKNMHPAIYQALYAEELEAVFAEDAS